MVFVNAPVLPGNCFSINRRDCFFAHYEVFRVSAMASRLKSDLCFASLPMAQEIIRCRLSRSPRESAV